MSKQSAGRRHLRVGDSDFDFNSGFDGNGSDLLDDLGRRMKIDHALVNTHLEPGVGGVEERERKRSYLERRR